MSNISAGLLRVDVDDLARTCSFLAVTIAIPLLLFLLRQAYQDYKKQTERRRKLYAEAFATCMEYKEFPFVIYRRGRSNPEAERQRISDAIRDVQKRLAYHRAWLDTESPHVAKAYGELVSILRELPGREMRKAWKTAPIERDDQMSIANPIDWKKLEDAEKEYIKTVKRTLTPWWRFSRYR